MKNRTGFVSNSSASSFSIPLEALREEQADTLTRFNELRDSIIPDNYHDSWTIMKGENAVVGDTIMDNGDMEKFMKAIGLDPDKIEFGDSCSLTIFDGLMRNMGFERDQGN